MDFNNRTPQSSTSAPGSSAAAPSSGATKRKRDRGKWNRIGVSAIVAAVVILLIALAVFIGFSGNNSEDKYVDSSKLQAVFLNTGQVYFGNIKTLNNKYFVVTNIYYLQQTGNNSSNAKNAGSNVTLVKLGCELHEPYDQMVINSDQVTFWENLQDNGQVAKAVANFEKQNPNGLKCADQSSSSSTNSSNAAQNATTNNSSSTKTSGSSATSSGSGTTNGQ
jgi:hypothetical protein